VDEAGAYWVAMFEGARLLRYAPSGELLADIALPVRCPTMPCFGGEDRRTLFITTARDKRPADELTREPWAGAVLTLRVDVPGLPAARSAL
jgi:sugar lactone lactonase YvrE